MANNEVYVRYKLAAKTNLEWKAIESTFKPLLGEICFYIDTRQAKLGDGETYLQDLPFQWLTENEINIIINTLLKSLSANDVGAIPIGEKGVAKGVAELDENGHILASQLPSFVDDIVEGYLIKKVFYKDSTGTEDKKIIPESGKIYVDLSNSKHKCYRWGGDASGYVAVSNTVTLGTTSDTAFRGDHGQIAYEHATTNKGIELYDTDNNGNNIPGLFKIKTNADGHIIGYAPVTKNDILNLGIDGANTTYDEASESASGLMSASDKKKLNSIEDNANYYEHPENSPYVEGLYKFEVDSLGHVVKATAVTKEDITALGISDNLADEFVSKDTIIPIESGGTGATTVSSAISNLGAVDTTTEQTIDAVKTFNKGIKIGEASMTFDAENRRIVFVFPE